MVKNYYIILGVSRTESLCGIRAAYRELAKRHHPDLAGHESTRLFQEITEAYSVLSDPDKRESYNKELYCLEERTKSQTVTVRSRHKAQPNRPTPHGPVRSSHSPRPPFEEVFESFLRDFMEPGFPQGERRKDFNIEVILSSQEAVRGGILPLRVPVSRVCPFCRGSGHFRPFSCSYCNGRGMIKTEEALSIRIPPKVRDGTVLEVPVRDQNHLFSLFVHVRIGTGRY